MGHTSKKVAVIIGVLMGVSFAGGMGVANAYETEQPTTEVTEQHVPDCTIEDASSGPVPCVHDGEVLNLPDGSWIELRSLAWKTPPTVECDSDADCATKNPHVTDGYGVAGGEE